MAKKGFIQKKSKDIPSFDVCTQILFNEIEPVGDQDLSKEIKILHRLSGSVWKSVIRLRGLNEKNRDVEGYVVKEQMDNQFPDREGNWSKT